LTAASLDNEICDWNRFGNRRQVGSFSGLCPKEDSSGGRHMQASVTKHGNTRARHLLLEAVWRMFQFQDEYKAILYWKDRIADGPAMTKARKKKIAVAIARQFLVDWWRIQTGKMTPEEVGLKMALPQSPSLSAWRTAQRKASA
jgi:transposase